MRVIARATLRYPELPVSLSDHERPAARATQFLLYVMPFAVICTSWLETGLGGDRATWFGLDPPRPFGTDESAAELAEVVHKWLAYSMLGVVAAQVGAIAKHRRRARRAVPDALGHE